MIWRRNLLEFNEQNEPAIVGPVLQGTLKVKNITFHETCRTSQLAGRKPWRGPEIWHRFDQRTGGGVYRTFIKAKTVSSAKRIVTRLLKNDKTYHQSYWKFPKFRYAGTRGTTGTTTFDILSTFELYE